MRSEILGMTMLLAAVPIVWLVGLMLLEYPITHHWANPVSRTMDMTRTMLSLNDAGYGSPTGAASMPWTWLIKPGGWALYYTPHYLSAISWTIWALIMPSMAYVIFELARGRFRCVVRRLRLLLVLDLRADSQGHAVAMFTLMWFIGVYGLLVVLKLVTHRLMYHFYFYPAVPAVCLAIGWGIWKLWGLARRGQKRKVVFLTCLSVYILATLATFVIMSPYGTNLVTLPSLGG